MGAPAVAALPSGAHGVFVTGDCAPLCWDARGGPISTLPRWPHPQLRSTTSTQPASKFFLLQNAQAQPLVIRWSKTHAQLPPRPSPRLPTPQLRWLCRPLLLGAYASIADPRSLSARGSGGLNALLPTVGPAESLLFSQHLHRPSAPTSIRPGQHASVRRPGTWGSD